MIFETYDIRQGWDGTFKGQPVQQVAYVYKIVYNAYPKTDEQQLVTGNVVVVR